MSDYYDPLFVFFRPFYCSEHERELRSVRLGLVKQGGNVMLLRKILLSTVLLVGAIGAASASDLPTTKGPPAYVPPPPVFTWTGLYAGGQVGYQWGTADTDIYANAGPYLTSLPSYNPNGVAGGAHVGYNYQIGQFVVGVEGDADGSSYSGSNSALGSTPPFSSYSTRIPVEGSIRGRIGYAFDHALFYATGGVAIADVQNSYASPGFTNTLAILFIPTVPPGYDAFSSTRIGWTVGGGVEYALDNNWSVRGEYRYTDYGSFNEYFVNTYPGDYARVHLTDNRVQLGFSYKFDWFAPVAPVVAKY
ncbi:MAG: outer membrane protein [Methylovirgula sp.]